jgi:hypothetical protein
VPEFISFRGISWKYSVFERGAFAVFPHRFSLFFYPVCTAAPPTPPSRHNIDLFRVAIFGSVFDEGNACSICLGLCIRCTGGGRKVICSAARFDVERAGADVWNAVVLQKFPIRIVPFVLFRFCNFYVFFGRRFV